MTNNTPKLPDEKQLAPVAPAEAVPPAQPAPETQQLTATRVGKVLDATPQTPKISFEAQMSDALQIGWDTNSKTEVDHFDYLDSAKAEQILAAAALEKPTLDFKEEFINAIGRGLRHSVPNYASGVYNFANSHQIPITIDEILVDICASHRINNLNSVMASLQRLKIDVDLNPIFQSALDENLTSLDLGQVETILKIADDRKLTIFLNQAKLQESVDRFDDVGEEQKHIFSMRNPSSVSDVLCFAKKYGMKLKVKQSVLQAELDGSWSRLGRFHVILPYAKEHGMKLEITQQNLQEALDSICSYPCVFESWEIKIILDLAKEHGLKQPEVKKTILQKSFERVIVEGCSDCLQRITDLASEHGIALYKPKK